jgi:hypothetical protein
MHMIAKPDHKSHLTTSKYMHNCYYGNTCLYIEQEQEKFTKEKKYGHLFFQLLRADIKSIKSTKSQQRSHSKLLNFGLLTL